MKKIISLFFAVLMLVSLAACGAEGDVPLGMKLASNREIVDYTLYIPEDWVIISQKGMTQAQVSLSDTTSIIVTHHSHEATSEYSDSRNTLIAYLYGKDAVNLTEEKDVTLPEYSEALLSHEKGYLSRVASLFDTVKEEETGNTVTTFKMIENPSFTTLKKGTKQVAAVTFVYSGTLDGATVQQKLVIAYEDAYFYNLTFTTAPTLYDSHKDTFNTILSNFSFD